MTLANDFFKVFPCWFVGRWLNVWPAATLGEARWRKWHRYLRSSPYANKYSVTIPISTPDTPALIMTVSDCGNEAVTASVVIGVDILMTANQQQEKLGNSYQAHIFHYRCLAERSFNEGCSRWTFCLRWAEGCLHCTGAANVGRMVASRCIFASCVLCYDMLFKHLSFCKVFGFTLFALVY